MKIDQADLGTHVVLTPIFLFGVVASIFLIRGAKWARTAVGIIALSLAGLVVWGIVDSGWRSDLWADYSLSGFALASVILLMFDRHKLAA